MKKGRWRFTIILHDREMRNVRTATDPEFNLGVEFTLPNHMSGTDEFCTESQTRSNSRQAQVKIWVSFGNQIN